MDLNEKYCSQASISCVLLTYRLAAVLELLQKEEGKKKKMLLRSVYSTSMYISGVIGMWEFILLAHK